MSDFDIRAIRGHLRIAFDHVNAAIVEFDRLKSENERLRRELDEGTKDNESKSEGTPAPANVKVRR